MAPRTSLTHHRKLHILRQVSALGSTYIWNLTDRFKVSKSTLSRIIEVRDRIRGFDDAFPTRGTELCNSFAEMTMFTDQYACVGCVSSKNGSSNLLNAIPELQEISEEQDTPDLHLQQTSSDRQDADSELHTSEGQDNAFVLRENASVLQENASELQESASELQGNASDMQENSSELQDNISERQGNASDLQDTPSKQQSATSEPQNTSLVSTETDNTIVKVNLHCNMHNQTGKVECPTREQLACTLSTLRQLVEYNNHLPRWCTYLLDHLFPRHHNTVQYPSCKRWRSHLPPREQVLTALLTICQTFQCGQQPPAWFCFSLRRFLLQYHNTRRSQDLEARLQQDIPRPISQPRQTKRSNLV